MHLMIPFAAPGSEAGRQALSTGALPNLSALLAGSAPPQRDVGDETSLSPPHERVLARLLGLDAAGTGTGTADPADGQRPWGAWWAQQGGGEAVAALVSQPGGLLQPCHWHVATDQVTMLDPEDLQLTPEEATALCEAVRDLFESEGFVLQAWSPTRWWLGHPSLAGLAIASPDRVIGRDIDPWLPRSARLWRRLQNEVQMRWHEHPINEARDARGLPPVNSLWLSGCGTWPREVSPAMPADLRVDERLRRPALAGDWGAWIEAWTALDNGPLAELRAAPPQAPWRLTLCGEASAATWTLRPPSVWQRLTGSWRRFDARSSLVAIDRP